MYKVKIWDKIESINGVDAKNVIKSHRINETDDIFLVIDEMSNRVLEMQFKDIICANYKLDINMSCEKVAQRYLELREEESQQKEKEQTVLGEQESRIAILEKENKALKDELSKMQISLASLVSAIEK